MFRLLRPPAVTDPRAWLQTTSYTMARSVDDVRAYLRDATIVGADFETPTFNVYKPNPPVCLTLSNAPCSALYVPTGHMVGYQHNLPIHDVLDILAEYDARNGQTIWYNYLYDGTILKVTYDRELHTWHDCLFAMWLHDCEARTHGLKASGQRLLGLTMPALKDTIGSDDDEEDQRSYSDLDPEDADTITYACADADVTRRLWLDRRVVEKRRQQQAVYDLERALLPAFRRAMLNGCYLDDHVLAAIEHEIGAFQKKGNKILRPMRPGGLLAGYDLMVREAFNAGPDVNINSNPQMVPLLLAAGVPLTEKTDGGAISLSSKVIASLSTNHPGVAAFIAWKKLESLDRNYVRKLRAAVATFGAHVRFPFKQYGAPTGRMACGGDGKKAEKLALQGYVNVNIQSMPDSDKEEYLPDLRRAVVPDDPDNPDPNGPWSVVSIDYSQLQLRIAANIFREPAWVKAYQNNEDLHMVNARAALADPKLPAMVPDPDDPTKLKENPKRKLGKTMGFAILFQAGEETVAKAAKIAVTEAKRVLDTFWTSLPTLATGIDQMKRRARTEKQSRTWLGRQRPLEAYFDAGAPRHMVSAGEREAINHPVQGGEADLFKIAAVRVDRLLTERDWHRDVQVMLYVHDEIVFRVRSAMVPDVVPALLATMEAVHMPGCPVPLTCDAAVGPSWGALVKWKREPRENASMVEPAHPQRSRPANPPPPAPPTVSFRARV